MNDLFGRDKPTGFGEFKDWAWSEWQRRHGINPPWGRGEFTCLHKIHERLGDPHARRIWAAYLDNGEPFYSGHDPKKLLNQLSRFAAEVPSAPQPEEATGDKPSAAQRAAVARNLEARGLEFRRGLLVSKDR